MTGVRSEIVPPLDPSLPPSVRGRDRYWDWSNGSAIRAYYVEEVVLPALRAGTDCLFFDNGSSGGPSGGWDDVAWPWHDEYNEVYGAPCGAPQRLDATTWTRNFTRCTVWLNVSAQRARVHFFDRANSSAP